jgi:hypothetical protein
MNPFYNEKVEEWIKSTKSCRDELVKDANVVTFDDADADVKTEEETDNNGNFLDEMVSCANDLMEFWFRFKYGGSL